MLEDVLPGKTSFENHLVEHDFGTIGKRAMLLSGRQINHVQLVLLAIEDITERLSGEKQQKVLEDPD